MKTKVKKYGFAIFMISIMAMLLFQNMTEINKAKISLKVLGLHKNNVSKFSEIKELILVSKFQKTSYLDSIKVDHKRLIENYINEDYGNKKKEVRIKITEEFARKEEKWNSSCLINGGLPNRKFDYILHSDKSLIICSLTGGLGTSNLFEFFKIGKEELELIGSLNSNNNNIFDLALLLKFDKGLIDWKSESQNNILLN